MSSEVLVRGPATGATLYFRILGSGFSVWNAATVALEAYSSANWINYGLTLTEEGATNIYAGNFPAALPAGVFGVDARRQTTATPLVSDVNCGTGDVQWNGTKSVPLSDLATSGQIGQLSPLRLARGTMVRNWPIYLKSSADHITPFTSGVISGQIWRDGATSPGPLQSGAFVETGLGTYSLQALTSGDLLGDTIKLVFTANGVSGGQADPLVMSFVTQRTSGS